MLTKAAEIYPNPIVRTASERSAIPGPGLGQRDTIADRLGTAILSGQYEPGDILGSEIAFAAALKVSRGVYREALQVLAAKGLVESRRKAGTRVLPRSRWNMLDPDVLAWMFAGKMDAGLFHGLIELRAVIGPAVASMAAERRCIKDLEAMEAALVTMRKHTLSTYQGRVAANDFHEAIIFATCNEAFMCLSSSINSTNIWTGNIRKKGISSSHDLIAEHYAVYDRISARDSLGARNQMTKLIEGALQGHDLRNIS